MLGDPDRALVLDDIGLLKKGAVCTEQRRYSGTAEHGELPGRRVLADATPRGRTLSLDPPTWFENDLLRAFWVAVGSVVVGGQVVSAGLPSFSTFFRFRLGLGGRGGQGRSGGFGWAVDGVEEVRPGVLPSPVVR